MRRPLRIFSTVLVLSIVAPSLALADVAADKSKADALFKEGRALAKQEKWAEACPKFEASQQLDPAAGTQLNIAVCHARVGKNASAYAELVESLTNAQKAKREDRIKVCKAELAALEPKVARITVDVAAPPASLTVTIDGEALPPGTLGIAHVVDPGEHSIRASAPGKKSWETKSTVSAGDRVSVAVPELETDAGAPIVATTTATPTNASPPTTTTTTTTMTDTTTTTNDSSSRKTIAYVVGGVGIAALGVGTFFAIRASSLDAQKSDAASAGDGATASDKADQARSAVTLARVGLGVGIVGVGVGAYLLLTGKEPPAETKSAGISVSPAIGPGFGGLSFGGAW